MSWLFHFAFYNLECIWYLNNIIFLLLRMPHDINIIILLASMRIYYNIYKAGRCEVLKTLQYLNVKVENIIIFLSIAGIIV